MDKEKFYNALDEGKDVYYLLDNFSEAEEYFRFAFNGVVYGLSEKSFYNAIETELKETFEHVSNAWASLYPEGDLETFPLKTLKYLAEQLAKNSGGLQIAMISKQCSMLPSVQRKWYIRAILHDLRCGIGLKTINNVFSVKGLRKIPKFEMQLCKKIDVYDETSVFKKIHFPCSMELKEDGYRMQAEIGGGLCILTSRRGKDRTADYPEIVREIEALFGDEHIILDGEMVAKEENSPSSFQKLCRKDDTSRRIFVVFDILNDEKLPYRNRWDNLKSLFTNINSVIIRLIEHYTAQNIKELQDYYEELNRRKEEGIIIKLDEAPYKRGSRKYMFKCKKVLDADLKIIGWKFGEGRRSRKVATLELIDASGTIKGDVGSGIDDVTCEELTRQAIEPHIMPEFVGKICQIQYSELTETGSIRFPRFICIRDDKDESDDLGGQK